LKRILTWLNGKLPYAQASEVVAELRGISVPVSSNWRIGQASGQAIQKVLEAEVEQEKAQAREWSTPGGPSRRTERMGISMDGAMINIRDEGWKEFKLSVVGQIECREEKDVLTGDLSHYGHIVKPSYVAHLGGPEEFGWRAWAEAQRRGWNKARDSVVIGDGAVWIWNQKAEHFHDSVGIVDWYHATEHLGQAKQAIYPDEGAGATRWLNLQERDLYLGHTWQVAKRIETAAAQVAEPERAAELRTTAGYFKNNRDRMQYQDFRMDGWPIGSGTIESTAKQYKLRVTGPGMRWSRSVAINILAICSVALTSRERFKSVWDQASSLPQN
jgi:hypothetical protein